MRKMQNPLRSFSGAAGVAATRLLVLSLCMFFFPVSCAGRQHTGQDSPWLIVTDAAGIQANPAQLNSAILRGTDLDGLRLENVTISHATFMQTSGRKVVLKNVVFDNCRFINAAFSDSSFEQVMFKGGIITCLTNADNLAQRSSFVNTVFSNVVFDGTSMDNPKFELRDSFLTLRNTHNLVSAEPLIKGDNIRLVLHNAILRSMTVAQVGGVSTLQARDCIFEKADFGASRFSAASLHNCLTYGPPVLSKAQMLQSGNARR
jgi:uncharacterized protein YjbI with pentapeptide repeats